MKTARILTSAFFLFFIFHFSFLIPAVSAQANSYNIPNTNPDVPKDMHFWTQTVMIEVLSAATCQLAGVDPVAGPNGKCLGIDQKTGKIGFVENGGGAIGLMGNLIAVTYTPPLHFSDYTRYLAQNFGIVKPAYAQQGVGFKGLTPLLPLWTAFRDIVYLVYVAVFAIVGLFIMLRVKIDPRTVMGIGNQLPKLIVSILLVTFSFAISGFLIDLMYVSTYLSVNVIASASQKNNSLAEKVYKEIYTPPIGFANEILGGDFGGIFKLSSNASGSIRDIIASAFAPKDLKETIKFPGEKCDGKEGIDSLGCWVGGVIGGTVGTVLSQIFGWVVSWIVGIIAFVVVVIALLFALFRLWIILLSSYVFILIDVVTAPFWIIFGVFPGSPIGFSAWIRDIVANLAVFPVTLILFSLGKVFIDEFSAGSGTFFTPPLIGNPSVANTLGALIGLGIILISPQVATITKDLLKPPQFKYGASIIKSIGVGAGAVNIKKHAEGLGQFGYSTSHINEGPIKWLLGKIPKRS